MTTQKHTPGPWAVRPLMGRPLVYKDREPVAEVSIPSSYFLPKKGSEERETVKANANLIAAAPDLYDALVRIYEEATGPAARHRETPKIVATIAMTAIESAGGGVD